MKFFYFLLSFVFTVTWAEEVRFKPFSLKSVNGATVQVVAVYRMDSEGMTFSPHPNGPLIGANELATVTTAWENIDTSSLKSDTELYNAYKKATSGESVVLNMGSHYNDLSDFKQRISKVIPKITIYSSNGRRVKIPLTEFVIDKDLVRSKRWLVDDSEKSLLVTEWKKICDELEYMVYRPEVSKLQYELEKSMAIIRRLDPKSGTFNDTSARDLARLFELL